MVPLCIVDTDGVDHPKRFLGLDALRNRAQLHRSTDLVDGSNHLSQNGIFGNMPYKAAVDLQILHRKASEIRE